MEIGPRCVLEIIRIFDGSFCGSTLYENTKYITPNELRRAAKVKMQSKYVKRAEAKNKKESKDMSMPADELEGIFAS